MLVTMTAMTRAIDTINIVDAKNIPTVDRKQKLESLGRHTCLLILLRAVCVTRRDRFVYILRHDRIAAFLGWGTQKMALMSLNLEIRISLSVIVKICQ